MFVITLSHEIGVIKCNKGLYLKLIKIYTYCTSAKNFSCLLKGEYICSVS